MYKLMQNFNKLKPKQNFLSQWKYRQIMLHFPDLIFQDLRHVAWF